MPLAPRTRLGPYEILAQIGVGGMGEVYLATDTNLKRDVAVKVLPVAVAADPERLARFQREAEVLAALNHPHIAQIYGLEKTDRVTALVMELVEGPTLADRIRRGPIPVDEALSIARQIAEALEAAHQQSIIHRDLKPANVKVRKDGTAKVLDFGLAKAIEPAQDSELKAQANVTNSPTITSPARLRQGFGEAGTEVGVILGTAAYMSPEQARGDAVDKRSDLWAFGCVLYEMLTGRRPFAGDGVTETLANVLKEEPDWAALPAGLPSPIHLLLRRCLRKEIKERWRDAGDVRLQLDDLSAAGAPVPEIRHRDVPRAVVVGLGAATVAAVLVAAWSLARAPAVAPSPLVRYVIDPPAGEEFIGGAGLPPLVSISRDGRVVVYVARGPDGNKLYRRQQDDSEAHAIKGTEGGVGPSISPDGQWVAFAAGGMLKRVAIQGGEPHSIAKVPNLVGATWTSDDAIVYVNWDSGLFRVSASGGTPEPLTTPDAANGEFGSLDPHAAPNGTMVLFTARYRGRLPQIEMVETDTRRRHVLAQGTNPHLVGSSLVFARGGTLFTAPFDVAGRRLSGEPAPRLDGVWGAGRSAEFSVSADGTLAYFSEPSARRRLVWIDRNGVSRPLTEEIGVFLHPRVSPDGKRVLVQAQNNEFLVYDVARGSRARLTATGSRPVWEPDGTRISFQSEGNLYSVPVDESQGPELLLAREPPASALFPLAWSRRGELFLFSRPTQETNRDIFIMRRGMAPEAVAASPRDERAATFSPDGLWIGYSTTDVGREEEVSIQPYPGPSGRIVIARGTEPVWSPFGNEIFFRSPDGGSILTVDVKTRPTLSVGAPRTLFRTRFPLRLSFWSDYDVTPDGRLFVIPEAVDDSRPRLNVALNWLAATEK